MWMPKKTLPHDYVEAKQLVGLLFTASGNQTCEKKPEQNLTIGRTNNNASL